MILSDTDIATWQARYEPLITPFKQENVQPASVDLTLHDHFLVPITVPWAVDLADISSTADAETYHDLVCPEAGFMLPPGGFVLGSTVEEVHLPRFLVARVEGKSSIGRLGLLIHSTAGFIDPGFSGRITLELTNVYPRPIILHPGLKICQISFMKLDRPSTKVYGDKDIGSKYQGQTTTTASKYAG